MMYTKKQVMIAIMQIGSPDLLFQICSSRFGGQAHSPTSPSILPFRVEAVPASERQRLLFSHALSPSIARPTMKLALALCALAAADAFVAPPAASTGRALSSIAANIRGPTDKNEVLEFGWDGTTALGGAVDNSKPARMLDEIREAGETQSSACELFNANLGEFGCAERLQRARCRNRSIWVEGFRVVDYWPSISIRIVNDDVAILEGC